MLALLLQRFLLEVIDNGGVDGSHLQGDPGVFVYEVRVRGGPTVDGQSLQFAVLGEAKELNGVCLDLQVYIAWPECMLSVLPRIEDQLKMDVVDTRTKACELIGRLLLIPGTVTRHRHGFHPFYCTALLPGVTRWYLYLGGTLIFPTVLPL